MHSKGCPKGGRMKMTIETTSYPANPHKVLVRVIYDALGRGRRPGGMSKSSIRSRIEQTYRCKLGTRFEKELTKSLKRLVRTQSLEKNGYRYKMATKAPSNHGWRLHDALPVTCRCRKPCSRSSSRCPGSRRSCKPYGGVTRSSSQSRCGCRSRSRSRSRSVRWRRRRVGIGRRKRKGAGRRRRRSRRKGKSRGRSRKRKRASSTRSASRSQHSSRSRSTSRMRSRSRTRSHSRGRSVRRVYIIRSRTSSRTRGRSLTRRTRTTSTSRSQTRSASRKRRRIQYTYRTQSRSTSRSTNGGRSPPPVLVPVPKLDAKRGLFEPGLVPAMSTSASTSHSSRRASPGAASARSRVYSPSPTRNLHYRSSSVPPASSTSGFPSLPFLKPSKPALRQSAPQSPIGTDTLTPKSMMKFLTH